MSKPSGSAAHSAARNYHDRNPPFRGVDSVLDTDFDDVEEYTSIAAYELERMLKNRHGSLYHG